MESPKESRLENISEAVLVLGFSVTLALSIILRATPDFKEKNDLLTSTTFTSFFCLLYLAIDTEGDD